MSEGKLLEGWYSAESFCFDKEGKIVFVHSEDPKFAKTERAAESEVRRGYFQFSIKGTVPGPTPVDGALKCEDR